MSKRFNTINGSDFVHMVTAAGQLLHDRAEQVNALNVFPVPDGDTGTNMNLTLTSGVNELKKNSFSHIDQAAEALSKGLLMGARGNSGVILSQLFRGLAKAVQGQESVNPLQFAAALQEGVDTAYKAVVRPVEGTILTVAKEAARHAVTYARRCATLNELMEDVVRQAKEALDRTPDQLPVLKQVGVVDAGGQGLLIIYEGFLAALSGDRPANVDFAVPSASPVTAELVRDAGKAQSKIATEDIKFPYDMEFFIDKSSRAGQSAFREEAFRNRLEKLGDSIIVIPDGDVVKVHVHSNHPGDVLNAAIRYGEIHRIHILNMKDQHRELIAEDAADSHAVSKDADGQGTVPQAVKAYAVIAVSAGQGIADIFASLGVDLVLSGGQTMNPSTEDIMNSIRSVRAETVYILPNNSNIILAAQQAQSLAACRVEVIPTKTIPQGIAAALAFRESESVEANVAAMTEAIRQVRSGQVTYAVRNTQMDGLDIRKDDFLAIMDNKIIAAHPDVYSACTKLLEAMVENGGETITVLTGEGADDALTARLTEFLAERYPEAEVEVHAGGQPVYAYIFSVE